MRASGRDGQRAGRWAQRGLGSISCSFTLLNETCTPMLVQALLKGTLPRQYERVNRHLHLVQPFRTLRVRSSRVQPLYMQTEPHINVYAKNDQALQTAKALLSKDKLVTAKGVQAPTYVQLHFSHGNASQAAFNAEAFLARLSTKSLGCTLLTAAELPSTQTLLHDNAGAVPNGAVCVADRQVMGKGRGHNTWESPAGCLMFSMLTHLKLQGVRLPFVQYVASLAIVQAVQELARERLQGQEVDVRIKWPNDVYGNQLKIGGILCQSAYRDQAFHVVIGTGINLSNRHPTTCIDALIEEQHKKLSLPGTPATIPPEALLAAILNNLESMLEVLVQDGFAPLELAYLKAWLHSGQQVVLEEGQDGQSRQVPLTVQGLTPSGYLKAIDQGGQLFELHPDGNSLDFFKGLVRKKMPS